jgi:anti-anti-sigma regulatory factor
LDGRPKQSFNKNAVLFNRKTIGKMKVKIDTKEKFHVINILEPVLTANMTGELEEMLQYCVTGDVKNIILNLQETNHVEADMAIFLLKAQQHAYDKHHSFVLCALPKSLMEWLDKEEYLELMNITPTESEAWDIVQMEEIEREMFD